MDMLVEALRLKPFMPVNRMNPSHGTSLRISPTPKSSWEMHASVDGWQVVSAAYSIPMASIGYFEVRIICNPDRREHRGGLAIGICGHVPKGKEIHSVRLTDSILYNSPSGIVGDAFSIDNVTKGVRLEEGDLFGIKHDASTHRLEFLHTDILLDVHL
jgi:hypothetical protein